MTSLKSLEELSVTLRRIDGRSYAAYRDIAGSYRFGGAADEASLFIDHVQRDPFAAPSKLRLRISMERAGLPRELFDTRTRRMALGDHLARRFRDIRGRTKFGRANNDGMKASPREEEPNAHTKDQSRRGTGRQESRRASGSGSNTTSMPIRS